VSAEAAPAVPREVELKYLVRDEPALRQWLTGDWGGALDGVEVSDITTVEVEDRYVDTARGALARAGFGARVRREGSGPFVLTVKSTSRDRPAPGAKTAGKGSRALTRRMEVEGPANERLDPDGWPPSAAQSLVNEVRGGARLRALFTIAQRRERRLLRFDAGPAEVTLDWVAVLRDGQAVGSFSVLEVEAKSGTGENLEHLAETLEATGYVTPEPRSKEEIARALVDASVTRPRDHLPPVPRSPGIGVEDTLAEAGRKVLRMHLARMLAQEAGTRSGEDIEDLHRMRVATRRMRAAWLVFEGAYRPRVARRYVRELRGVARALGAVRDLDVLREGLDAYVGTLPEAGGEALAPLRTAWREERERARQRLIALLDSRAYHVFVEDYLELTESVGAGARTTPSEPGQPVLVRDTAGSRILAAYEHVRAYETVMGWADLTTLHALRIEGKRLRYTLEYFAEVLPVSSRALITSVTQMQDHLGLMNDAHVAATLSREWLNAHAAELSAATRAAVGLYLESREDEAERLRRTFRPLWRRITGRTFRRTLGAAVTQIG
jgi:CHAD domain-containing protein